GAAARAFVSSTFGAIWHARALHHGENGSSRREPVFESTTRAGAAVYPSAGRSGEKASKGSKWTDRSRQARRPSKTHVRFCALPAAQFCKPQSAVRSPGSGSGRDVTMSFGDSAGQGIAARLPDAGAGRTVEEGNRPGS